MAISEHYSLKLFGTILGQQFLNTFTYRQTAGTASNEAAQLINVWSTTILQWLADSAGDYTDYDRVEAFAIEDPTDYSDEVPIYPEGIRAIALAQQPPSYTAWGLRSNRAGAGTRSSYKRFCGLSEDDSDANALTSAFLTRVGVINVRAGLSATLVHGGGNTWVPVQLQSGWTPGFAPVENFEISAYGIPYLTSQVSRRL